MQSPDQPARRNLAWAGMLGAALFVGVFTLDGWLRPGYDPLSAYVSELSLGPRGWVQIANFLVAGTLFLLFARTVAAEFSTGKASRWGPRLFALYGFFLLLSGPFVMDPAGVVHQLAGAVVFTVMAVTCFVFWRRFREDPQWQSFAAWTLAAGLITVMAVILLSLVPAPAAPPNALSPWAGLIQRTILVTFLTWTFSFAYRLNKQSPVT
jgi:hypothetical protein